MNRPGAEQLFLRDAVVEDSEPLVAIWHEGWLDAHRDILPDILGRHRTADALHVRLQPLLASTRVLVVGARQVGFHTLRNDELYQFYVDRSVRGTAAAPMLLRDAEGILGTSGVGVAWLACAIGNNRAARFYERHGWECVGVRSIHAETSEGPFPLDVWRFEKRLLRPDAT